MPNLIPFKYQLSIQGIDYTDAFAEGQFTITPYSEGTGFLLLQGQIALQKHNSNLDPRTNRDFFPGNQVVLTRNSGSELVPYFATTYIGKAYFDVEAQVCTIETVCWLSLLNKASNGKVGVCIEDQETGTPFATAVRDILLAAGIPLSSINVSNITGQLLETQQINEGDSLIGLAGALAYSQGFLLYQDTDGIIKAQADSRTAKLGTALIAQQSQLARYVQKSDASVLPPGKLLVEGNRLWPVKPSSAQFRSSESAGDFGLRQEIFERTYDRASRTATQEESVNEPIGNVTEVFGSTSQRLITSKSVTTEQYEAKPVPWTCDAPDEGRLISRFTNVLQPKAVALEEYLVLKAEVDGIDPQALALDIGIINAELQYETWEYAMPDNSPLCGTLLLNEFGETLASSNLPESLLLTGQYFVRRTFVKLEPRAAIFPLLADPILGRDPDLTNSQLVVNDFTRVPSEQSVDLWVLNPDGESWTRLSKQSIVEWRRSQRNVLAIRDAFKNSTGTIVNGSAYSYSLSAVLRKALTLVQVNSEIDRNTSPTEGGRFPSATRYGRTPYKITTKLQGVPETIGCREETLTLPDEVPLARVTEFANRALLREWGRSNAYLINSPDQLVPADAKPFGAWQVTETSTADIYTYEADGIALSITPTEAFYACVGLLAEREDGTTGTPTDDIWSTGLGVTSTLAFSDSITCAEVSQEGLFRVEDAGFLSFDDSLNTEQETELAALFGFTLSAGTETDGDAIASGTLVKVT